MGYLLCEKSEASDQFKRFKASVEKESSCTLKCLRTNIGGEFTYGSFNEFCAQERIKHQLTIAFTPQHNGVAESKNRTVMNMVRSILTNKNMRKVFWAEATNWVYDVLNRSPTTAVKVKTPHKAWSGLKPSVQHFRVFGCLAYTYIPDVKRTKLDDNSLVNILVGVSEESKGYRVYDPRIKDIIISRDVVLKKKKKRVETGIVHMRSKYK